MIKITTIAEYECAVVRGFNPLADWRMFTLPIRLRINLQHELFGYGDFKKQNDRFYHYCWESSLKTCQETGKPLGDYSAIYISHIISRGSSRNMAVDPRNYNTFCPESHRMWESEDNHKMNIYRENQIVINLLKQEYNYEKNNY